MKKCFIFISILMLCICFLTSCQNENLDKENHDKEESNSIVNDNPAIEEEKPKTEKISLQTNNFFATVKSTPTDVVISKPHSATTRLWQIEVSVRPCITAIEFENARVAVGTPNMWVDVDNQGYGYKSFTTEMFADVAYSYSSTIYRVTGYAVIASNE